MMLFYSSII